MAYTQQNIRNDNVRLVFEEIVSAGRISRAALSEKTGISLVTVGKIADRLLEKKAIAESVEAKASAGRRAGILTRNAELYAVLIEVRDTGIGAFAYDLGRKCLGKFEREYDTQMNFADNLAVLLGEAIPALLENRHPENCIGVGLLCDADGVNTAQEVLGGFFSPDEILTGNVTEYAARYSARDVEGHGEKTVLYLSVGKTELDGAVVNADKTDGKRLRFSDVFFPDGSTLSEKLARAKGTGDSSAFLALTLFNAMKMLSPDAIVFEKKAGYLDDGTLALAGKRLKELCVKTKTNPPLLYLAAREENGAHGGMILALCEKWIIR